MTMNFLLSFVFICIFGQLMASTDPCGVYDTYGFQSVSIAEACFQSVPFNKASALGTIAVMNQLVELYSFSDMASNSGEPWNMENDVAAGMTQITANVNSAGYYTSDWQFQQDVAYLFAALNDAHTFYEMPAGYSNCFVLRPVNVQADLSTGFQVTLRPLNAESESPVFHDYDFFDGAILTEIEGEDPETYFTTYAEGYVSTYKDPINRLMDIFSMFGPWTFSLAGEFGLPSADNFTVTVTLSNGTVLSNFVMPFFVIAIRPMIRSLHLNHRMNPPKNEQMHNLLLKIQCVED